MSTTTNYLKLTKPDMEDNISPVPYNDNFDIIDKEINNLKNDYVISQGIQNGWLFRRWNSGIAECWSIVYPKKANSYVAQVTNVPLPFALTNGVYGLEATIIKGYDNTNSALDMTAKVIPNNISPSVSAITVVVHSKSAYIDQLTQVPVSVSIIGRWK